jgi:hypothetical protein
MRTTHRPISPLWLGLLLSGVALFIANNPADACKTRRHLTCSRPIAVDSTEQFVKEHLAEAESLLRSNPEEALKRLRLADAALEQDRTRSPERQQQLKARIAGRILDAEEEIREHRFQQEERKARDFAALWQKAAELYLEGKIVEAMEVEKQILRKAGISPRDLLFLRIDSARAGEELRKIKDTKKRVAAHQACLHLAGIVLSIAGDIELPPLAQWLELTRKRSGPRMLVKQEELLLKALNTSMPENQLIKQQPLGNVLKTIEKRHDISFDVDTRSLALLGINMNTPVSVRKEKTTLRCALKQMLADIGLTFTIRKEGLRVTTPDRAVKDMVVRAYCIGDLKGVAGVALEPVTDEVQMVQRLASLSARIQSIEPMSWQRGGGNGHISINLEPLSVVVKQSAEIQFVLQGLLR